MHFSLVAYSQTSIELFMFSAADNQALSLYNATPSTFSSSNQSVADESHE